MHKNNIFFEIAQVKYDGTYVYFEEIDYRTLNNNKNHFVIVKILVLEGKILVKEELPSFGLFLDCINLPPKLMLKGS